MMKNLVVVGLVHRDKVVESLAEGVEDSALHDSHDSFGVMSRTSVAIDRRPRSDIARRCAGMAVTRLSAVVVGWCLLVGGIHRRR